MKAGVITIAVVAIAVGLFGWGMKVGTNDAAVFAAADDQILAAVAKQCGRRGHAVRTDAGYLCVYINNDGSAVTRAVFDNPVRGAM